MAKVLQLPPFPPTFPPGKTTLPRKTIVYARAKGARRYHVTNRQQKQQSLFTYVNKYWTHSLPFATKAIWKGNAAISPFTGFKPAPGLVPAKQWYSRVAMLGLYNGLYVDGDVGTVTNANLQASIVDTFATVITGDVTITELVSGTTNSFDRCFAWVTGYHWSQRQGFNVPLYPCGMEFLQQNAVLDPPFGILYTQIFNDPLYPGRIAGTPVRVWFMTFVNNWPVGPLYYDTVAA